MKRAIEELNEKYNINIYTERYRNDPYDHRGGYYTKICCVVNGVAMCVIKRKSSDLNKILDELENKIKEAKRGKNMRNMKDIEKIAKEFTELEESRKENRKNAIDMNLILNSDLKTIKEKYECKYVVDENDNLIFISVNAKPIKGGKIEYSALCYDFIDFLERHNKEVEVVYDPKEEEKEKKACPICGSIITFYPAISRLDNKTEICSDCGVCEAITIYKMSLENKKTDSKQD